MILSFKVLKAVTCHYGNIKKKKRKQIYYWWHILLPESIVKCRDLVFRLIAKNQEWGIIKGRKFLRPSITFINTELPKLRVSKATAFYAANSVTINTKNRMQNYYYISFFFFTCSLFSISCASTFLVGLFGCNTMLL